MRSACRYGNAGLGVLVFVSVVCGPAPAEDAPRSGWAAAREKYEELRTEIEDAYLAERAELPEKYQADLYRLEKRYQADGDYDGVLAARAEQTRYSRERTFSVSSSSSPLALQELQQKYADSVGEADKRRSMKLHGLAGDYLRHLEGMKKNHTRDGRLELASEVDAEVKRVQDSEAYREHKLLAEQSEEPSVPAPEQKDATESSPDAAEGARPVGVDAAVLEKKLKAISTPSARNPHYPFNDAGSTINEFVRFVWPHGIKFKMETVSSIVVRSVSYDAGGMPTYYVPSSTRMSDLGATPQSSRLSGITAMDLLERICAAYGCGYAFRDGYVVLMDANVPGTLFSMLTVEAGAMAAEFKKDNAAAAGRYAGKRVQITGVVDSLGNSLQRNPFATMEGGRIRVEFASDRGTRQDLAALVGSYENSRSSAGSSAPSGAIRRIGDSLAKPGGGDYEYHLTAAGECKIVGLTVYIKDARLYGWNCIRK